MEADVVLIGCNVLTMNLAQPYAEAIAIKEDKIVKVGSKKEVSKSIGKKTKIIELKGETVIPGLIDTHIHIADFGRFLMWLDLKGAKSIKEIQKMIRKRAHRLPQGKWILGQGWDQTTFVEKRYPDIRDLDEAAPEHPLVLYHQSGSLCIVNSKALEVARITKETNSPAGGTIEYDPETSEPTGLLRENAMSLVWEVIPEPDEKEVLDATSIACKKIAEAGVTSVNWIVSSLSEIELIRKLRTENKLPLRVYVIFPVDILDQITGLSSLKDLNDDWVRLGGVKVFADGSLAERTASLREPYSDDCTNKGSLLYTQKEINALVTKLHKANFRLIIHAMGDQAIEIVTSTLEEALNELPKNDHRYRIEHAAVLDITLINRIKKIGVIVAVQPCAIISEFATWSAIERLGNKRARWLYPIKTLIREGVMVSGGSDCPMEPISPFLGMQAAVTRQFFPIEQITVDDALRMYTVTAAYVSFDENIKGSIEEGKLADCAVISNDPRTIPSDRIENIEVQMTIVGGKIVYSKERAAE